MKPRRSAILKGHTDERRRAMQEMLARLWRGERVLVGTMIPIEPGTSVGKVGDLRILVKRRATHEEFLQAAPPDADLTSALTAPYYWELEAEPYPCPYCEEPVTPDEKHIGHNPPAHVECVLRSVMGSVAHQQGRCSCFVPGSTEGDPPGMTKREAARAAVKLWHEMNK